MDLKKIIKFLFNKKFLKINLIIIQLKIINFKSPTTLIYFLFNFVTNHYDYYLYPFINY